MSRAMSIGRAACVCGAGALAVAAGMGGGGCERGVRVVEGKDIRVDGRMPAVKPAGVMVVRGDEYEVGPPPYGYVKIVGGADPLWEAGGGIGSRSGLTWEFIGPRPMSSEYWSGEGNAGGRISSIAPHPTDANTCYIATTGGGVWRTTNGGTNWTPLTDELPILNSGAVAVDPTDPGVLFYGTGDYSTGSGGDGVFRSLDEGATWERVLTTAQVGTQTSAISVGPGGYVHVTGTSGYNRSNDGGNTWIRPIAAACTSVVAHPTDSNIVYVGRRGNGVYKSTNGGQSLTKLGGGLPTSGFQGVYLAMCKGNPNVLYAVLLSGGGLQGLYRSADAGATWTRKTATPNFPEYGDYACFVACDPANENIVFCGGVDPRYATAGIIRTTNGGDSWVEVSDGPTQVHPDHSDMAFGPGGTIWQGNDGGIYKSTNNGDNWTNCNGDLGAALIYNLVQHPVDTNRVMGGTQDNGTPEKRNSGFIWPQLQVGDGGFSVYDPTQSTRRYTTYVYLTITRWNNNSGAGITGPWGSDPVNFIAPLVGDPSSSTTLLGGTNRVWRTTNASSGSVSWTAISTNAVGGGGTLNAICVADGQSDTIMTGSSSGKVWVTTDAVSWFDRSAGLPSGQVSDVIISPLDAQTALVSYYNGTGARVLRSTNLGQGWTNVTGTLPSGVGVTALAADWATTPETLFAGSGAGVYVSRDLGATWEKDNATLPNVNVGDLFVDAANRTVTAGTYGRGAWRAALGAVCRADWNNDGTLDAFDYDDYVSAYFDYVGTGTGFPDYNGDGEVDAFDYDDFVSEYFQGCV